MKKIKTILFLTLFTTMICVSSLLAQLSDQNLSKFFSDKNLGGESIITSSKLSVDGEISSKTFEINIPVKGEYYLNAWVMGFNSKNGLDNINVTLNGRKESIGKLNVNKTNWQCASLVDNLGKGVSQKISLEGGTHEITFSTKVPYVPSIEFIRLAKDEKGVVISETRYNTYIDSLSNNKLPANYMQLRSDSLSANKLGKIMDDPLPDYLYSLSTSFNYTYYNTFYFYAGANVVFETKSPDPYSSDPVMHLLNAEDPINKGSWGDDDGGEGSQSKITCTIQYSGYYYVLVRSFWPNTSQTTNLYLYDNLYASNIAVAGKGLRCDHTLTEVINYFTNYLTGDSRLWVESYETGLNGKILGYNDDYYGGGDFYWGLNARVRKSYSQRMWNCFVTAYSSYNPTGTCDLYMRCKNSYTALHPVFPNLNDDDAVASAPASYYYNCISWSGGITSYWEWPLNSGSRYYVSGNPLASFDNYYGNNPVRYSGSEGWTYTRTGATSNNNYVDLWALNGSYTHGSCKKPANGHPHGYDWESKPGSLMRTFHPRYALNESSYGDVVAYYLWTGGGLLKSNGEYITSEESINQGLSIVERAVLTNSELLEIAILNTAIDEKELQEFESKYTAWKQTWANPEISVYSDPRKYAESKEYLQFFNYCVLKDKKVFPLLLEKLNNGDLFVIIPLEDLTYTGNEKLMEDVHKENLENLYTKDEVFVINTLLGNWLKYGKKLLANFDKYEGFTPKTKQQGLEQNMNIPENGIVMQSYPNPFNPTTQIKYGIPSDSKVTVKIYDVLGKETAVLVNNEFQNAGWHYTNWNGDDNKGNPVSSGIYFCRIFYNSQIQTVKLMLIR